MPFPAYVTLVTKELDQGEFTIKQAEYLLDGVNKITGPESLKGGGRVFGKEKKASGAGPDAVGINYLLQRKSWH